jgi:hypothetical protein
MAPQYGPVEADVSHANGAGAPSPGQPTFLPSPIIEAGFRWTRRPCSSRDSPTAIPWSASRTGRRPWRLGAGSNRAVPAPGRQHPRRGLRRFGPARLRSPEPRRTGGRAAPRHSGRGAGASGAKGRGGPGGPAGRRAAAVQPGRDQRALRAPPARQDLRAHGRAGSGGRGAEGSAPAAVLRLAGVAAPRPGVPETRGARVVRSAQVGIIVPRRPSGARSGGRATAPESRRR